MNKVKLYILNFLLEKILYKSKRGIKMQNFLNGYKTIIGLVLLVLCLILFAFGILVPEWVWGIIGTMLGTGIMHKFQKLQSSITEIKSTFKDQIDGK